MKSLLYNKNRYYNRYKTEFSNKHKIKCNFFNLDSDVLHNWKHI